MIKYLEKDYDNEIKDKKILVDFYADWCGPCKMLSKLIEDNVSEIDIDVLKVNVDKFPEIASRYGIMSIPTLLLISKNEVVKNQVGFLNLEELKEFINTK